MGAKGGSQMPMAGKMLNEEFAQRNSKARAARLAAGNQKSDEMFQTMMATGQQPYRSPYEPENLMAPMSNQNPGATSEAFNFSKFFDQNRFG